MTVPTGALTLMHHSLAVLISLLLVIMGTALLPPWLATPVFVALILTPLVLGAGAFEGSAVRLLTRSRPATEAEGVVLAAVPALGSPSTVRVRHSPHTTMVQVMGRRRHLIVSPRLVQALDRGWVSPQEAAALVVHADGYHRVAAPRREIAVTLAELPCRAVIGITDAVVRAFGWLPLSGVAWQLRGVVGAVTLYQSITGAAPFWPGVLGASVIALTYLVPAGSRVLRRRAELAGDQAVVAQNLGRALMDVLQRNGYQLSLDRRHRLREQPAPPASPPDSGGRHLHLVRS